MAAEQAGGRWRTWLAVLLVCAGLVGAFLAAPALAHSGRPVQAQMLTTPQVIAPALAADGSQEPPAPTPTPTPPAGPDPRTTALRAWADGDSTSYFVTLAFFDLMSRQGHTPVRQADYKISSGLVGGGGSSAVLGVPFSDWFSYLPEELATYAPDVVLFMVGANDAAAGYPERDPAFYRERVGAMMDLLAAPGRVVLWVSQPGLTRPDLAPRVPGLNALFAEEAATRPWVIFVDASGVTPDGGDGVHLSSANGYAVAELALSALYAQ